MQYLLDVKGKDKFCSPDKRGIYPSGNKTQHQNLTLVNTFLESFPKYQSHYSTSDKQYFSLELSEQKLYELYTQWCPNINKVSYKIFLKIFQNYNVRIYVLKQDTCKFCDQFQNKIISGILNESERGELENSRLVHQKRAEEIQSQLKLVQCELKNNSSKTLGISFDMQKVQPLPKISTSTVYYKRQL